MERRGGVIQVHLSLGKPVAALAVGVFVAETTNPLDVGRRPGSHLAARRRPFC